MTNKSIQFLSYKIFIDSLESIRLDRRTVINTINPHSYIVAEGDESFKNALKESDILLPDGVGITKAVLILKGEKVKKIAGMDLHDYMLKLANKRFMKCFYMGSSDQTLKKIETKLRREYSNISFSSYSPPFKNEFNNMDNCLMLERINSFDPDILFVGMTAPKQEKWVFENRDKINATIICSIGAVFDFYAGTIKRPHKFWINSGLEGVVRVFKEPKRLWRRFIFSDLRFMVLMFYLKFANIFKIKK